jgi:hypothetical protein
MTKPTNGEIADLLERIADILEIEDANPFRVRAYRAGASTISLMDESAADLVRADRLDELKAMPTIGDGLAAVIGEFVTSGHSSLLDDLETNAPPEAVLITVPGIGRELARRIVDRLHIKTLPELEAAAHDGRLDTVPGFGQRRVEGVQQVLRGMLSRAARSPKRTAAFPGQPSSQPEQRPSIALLLDIDAEYRRRAADGSLHQIAPRRFNPDKEAWLPVMNMKRSGWQFTAMFSNTAQAHELDKTDDWVVIYYERNHREQQNTVVTETQGPLKGKRVVRGRSAETQAYYRAQTDKVAS